MDTISEPPTDRLIPEARVAPFTQLFTAEMSQPARLEAELTSILGSGRDASITARYLGLDGRGSASLQEVGKEYRLTRERVRQIVSATVERVGSRPRTTPCLDRALCSAVDLAPIRSSVLETRLASGGIAQRPFGIRGLIQAAELLGRRIPFSLAGAGEPIVIRWGDEEAFRTVENLARRTVARWGMSSVDQVLTTSGQQHPNRREFATRSLVCLEDFRWLDEERGWFWLTAVAGNRVINRLHKILCVANPISIPDLRSALARNYRMRGFRPPEAVLLEFCRQIPGLTIDQNSIAACPALRPVDYLSRVEMSLFEVFLENGRAMARAELWAACSARGINRFTIDQHLVYSPFLRKSGPSEYSLIGRRN